MPCTNGSHHSQAAYRIQCGADDATMDAVVFVMANQFMAHINTTRHRFGQE